MNALDMTITAFNGQRLRLRGELQAVDLAADARPSARRLLALVFRYVPPALRRNVLDRVVGAYSGYRAGRNEPTPRLDMLDLVDELLAGVSRPFDGPTIDCCLLTGQRPQLDVDQAARLTS